MNSVFHQNELFYLFSLVGVLRGSPCINERRDVARKADLTPAHTLEYTADRSNKLRANKNKLYLNFDVRDTQNTVVSNSDHQLHDKINTGTLTDR